MNENERHRRNRIQGPHSALTDYLASHNISAAQIRDRVESERQLAYQQQQEAEDELAENTEEANASSDEAIASSRRRSSRNETEAEKVKRKKREQAAIEKIKASKSFKRRARAADMDEDDLAMTLYNEKTAPLPGQMENCEICDKRFTVTPYTRAGPNGGLLCTPCGKELDKNDDRPKKKPRVSGPGRGRRNAQSRILDGSYQIGSKSLSTLCVEMLAKNVDLAESLGDLPEPVIDKIARLFSKRRLLNPVTLPLFLQPTSEVVRIYDGSKLGADDLIGIFQVASSLKELKIRNAIHFKDEVMEYLLSRDIALEDFYLHGANLLAEEMWENFLKSKGKSLKSLKVYFTDKHFGDDTIQYMQKACPNLERLKICHNQKVTDDGVAMLSKLKSLRHLSLNLLQPVSSPPLVTMINKIGKDLETLSLTNVPRVGGRVLAAIHRNCRSLVKLRVTDSEELFDEDFSSLFHDWENPPLHFIDFQKCRNLTTEKLPDRSDAKKIGLSSDGFCALMKHSGESLRVLNIHACRQISAQAFEEVFAPGKVYPELRKLEISFCVEVTDFIIACIFAACPKMHEVNVFGCMKVKDARVPRGKLLVGVPNAHGMVIEGTGMDGV